MGMFELGPPNDIVASAPWDDAAANAPPGEVVKRERPSLERAASGAPEVADKEGDGAKAADEESAAQKHVADAEDAQVGAKDGENDVIAIEDDAPAASKTMPRRLGAPPSRRAHKMRVRRHGVVPNHRAARARGRDARRTRAARVSRHEMRIDRAHGRAPVLSGLAAAFQPSASEAPPSVPILSALGACTTWRQRRSEKVRTVQYCVACTEDPSAAPCGALLHMFLGRPKERG